MFVLAADMLVWLFVLSDTIAACVAALGEGITLQIDKTVGRECLHLFH